MLRIVRADADCDMQSRVSDLDAECDQWRKVVVDRNSRIAELEAALDEIHGASFRTDQTSIVMVPIGAWDNAMRAIKPKQER